MMTTMTTITGRSISRAGTPPAGRASCVALLAAGLLLVAFGAGAGPAPSPTPAPTGTAAGDTALKITLKWSTASEVDNYGFFVMRGDTVDGPFKQMNPKAIPGAGNSDTPSKYIWEDHEVEAGRTYYYYLDSISVQGAREKFSPVLSRTCCGTAAQAKPTPSPEPSPTPTPQAN